MPQINVNGELREVSQAEYDALTTNGQASTPAAGSYEQYAAARAKEQAVNKLADADANFETGTNVSPEFRQELTNIRTGADAAAVGRGFACNDGPVAGGMGLGQRVDPELALTQKRTDK